MKSSKGKDNASSLFGIKKIPGDHQIRNRLAPIPAATIFGSFQQVYQGLKKQGVIKKFFSLDEEILIALDGTEYFSSKKISCPHSRISHKKYDHQPPKPYKIWVLTG